jgi:PKD repeat protein
MYVNGESIADQNIVLWYIPVSVTDAFEGGDGYYCWTLQGEPNPITYPCYAGPMFVPLRAEFEHATPVTAGQTVTFTNTSVGAEPLTYAWDFGDGSGSSSEENPEYAYSAPGTYTITLTVSDAYGQATATSAIEVLPASAPFAAFSSNSPVVLGTTAVFTNTSGGEPPLSFAWDFGDGVGTSTLEHPTYDYLAAGTYTVTLTVTNAQGSATATELFTVLPEPPATYQMYVPLLRRE